MVSNAVTEPRGAGGSVASAETVQRDERRDTLLSIDGVGDIEAVKVDLWEMRLAADQELVALLAWEGYRGPQSDLLYQALAEYGWAVMRAWIGSGAIFGKCRSHGLRGLGETPRRVSNEADVEELASDVVSAAIVAFRDEVLRRGLWNPTGGASLKTFFIGQCLIRFVSIHRNWSHRVGREANLVADAIRDARSAGIGRPDELVTLRDEVARAALSMTDPILREIVVLNDAGCSHREIARHVGLGSAKAVERRLHKHRHHDKGELDAQP